MGMPFTRPNPVQAHKIEDLSWLESRHHDRVCISIDAGSLARLMQNRQQTCTHRLRLSTVIFHVVGGATSGES